MEKYLLCMILTFIVGVILAPLVIFASKKFKASQTILEYVDMHFGKQGTPTMGGFIFIFALMVPLCFFTENCTLAVISLSAMLGFGTLGFLDDFIKIRFKQNLGLRPYQKIIGQLGLSLMLAFFAYYSGAVGSTLFVPFTNITFDMGPFIVPFLVFVFLALVNSVNLTDGLDGLAGGVCLAFTTGLVAIMLIVQKNLLTSAAVQELSNLILLGFASIGALIAFLCFNIYPAKIFMGDTGSLALGGLLSCLAVFSRLTLLIPILGIMFVLSAVSVCLQVFYFKKTKKRIFLMAPLHHHFEKKGVNENRIVFVYIVITTIVSACTVLITLYSGG